MTSEPYSRLAAGYEAVMEHVDYASWAVHVRSILARHHPGAVDVLELGCGTGALARELQPMGPGPAGYRYVATDRSPEMLAVALKAAANAPITFDALDFSRIRGRAAADVVLLLYDGLNYLLEPAEVAQLFEGVATLLRPAGVFVFDQSTPANSRRPEWDFEDAGETPAFSYRRSSRYDRRSRLHRTTFRLSLPDGGEATEVHVQRAYTYREIEKLMAASPLEPVAAYDGFSLRPASPRRSERVHWVARRPE